MTQEMWLLIVAGSGLLMPMLLGLLPAGRRPVPVRATRRSRNDGAAERR
ncbi:hypothetical protein [Leifsonia sp. Root4]|nr:hypothetical protein [Leifsonia sp. Root4]